MEKDGCGMAMQWPREERKKTDGGTMEAGGGGGTGSVASVKGVPSACGTARESARLKCGKQHKTSDPRAEEVRRDRCRIRPGACPRLAHGDAPKRWTMAPFQSTRLPLLRYDSQPQPHQHVLRSWRSPNYSWPLHLYKSGGCKQHLAEGTFPDPAPKIPWFPTTIAACISS